MTTKRKRSSPEITDSDLSMESIAACPPSSQKTTPGAPLKQKCYQIFKGKHCGYMISVASNIHDLTQQPPAPPETEF